MCYSVSNTKSQKEAEALTKAKWKASIPYKPYFHLSAFNFPNLHIQSLAEPQYLTTATWGLIPEWASSDVASFRKKYHTFNARSEELFHSNVYAGSLQTQRCLIWADGFFEPHHISKKSIPYYCYIPEKSNSQSRQLFAFAGLYSQVNEGQLTCTIITTEANDFFVEIHNLKKRMPLVLKSELHASWLDPTLNNQQINALLKDGFTPKTFKAHPVSSLLYQPKVDTNIPSILNEVEKGTLF